MGRFIAVSMVLWVLQLCAAAQAQTLRIALFKTASSASEEAPLAAALDPMLQAEVGRAPQLNIAALPPLDLPSLQLALDCVGETASCLAVATERSKVDALLAPSLIRSGTSLVVSLLFYNPQLPSPIQVLTRSVARESSDAVVMDAAKALVQELFGLAPPPGQEPPPVVEPEPDPASQELPPLAAEPPPSQERPSLLVPLVFGAAGLGVMAIGIGFGVASNGTESDYAKTKVKTNADAQHASELLSSARTQATIANVALGLGAASCVAGGVLFFLQRNRRPDTAPNAEVALGLGYLGVRGGF
ncbi:MAG TPA: hypothetical protein VFN67_19795 [Polyangiales bacterium]|nr:hypothetical protein [Polyangiales bacterium]